MTTTTRLPAELHSILTSAIKSVVAVASEIEHNRGLSSCGVEAIQLVNALQSAQANGATRAHATAVRSFLNTYPMPGAHSYTLNMAFDALATYCRRNGIA